MKNKIITQFVKLTPRFPSAQLWQVLAVKQPPELIAALRQCSQFHQAWCDAFLNHPRSSSFATVWLCKEIYVCSMFLSKTMSNCTKQIEQERESNTGMARRICVIFKINKSINHQTKQIKKPFNPKGLTDAACFQIFFLAEFYRSKAMHISHETAQHNKIIKSVRRSRQKKLFWNSHQNFIVTICKVTKSPLHMEHKEWNRSFVMMLITHQSNCVQ